MRHVLGALAAAMLVVLPACGGEAPEGGLSADEQRRLDEAAERLDAAQPDLRSLPADDTSLASPNQTTNVSE